MRERSVLGSLVPARCAVNPGRHLTHAVGLEDILREVGKVLAVAGF
ncbi:hypothetical protein [Streptomyces sp. NPDC060035]